MYITVSQAAKIVGVSRSRIYEAIEQGWLKPVEGMPHVILCKADVEKFRDREKPKGGRPKKLKEEE